MPICPRCRSRYDYDTERCPACDVVLLEVLEMEGPLPDMEDFEEDDWVEPVGETPVDKSDGALKLLIEEPMPEMAAMIREFLQNCGIGCVVHEDPIGHLYRLPVPLSRARVYVRETDWDEARQLVDQFFRKP